MFTRRVIVTILFSLFGLAGYAQQTEFCEAVSAILRDAPNQFKNTRTKMLTTSGGNATYKCGITVPGTINSRVVIAMGVFYEGALYQSKSTEGLSVQYYRYKKMLEECLSGKGFSTRQVDNFYSGLEEYKKIMFMPTAADGKSYRKGVGHVAMEVDYNKSSKLYTLIFYIFEQ